MTDKLQHRGPDDAGIWYDAAAGVGLGHRRLSILDLSPSGHQPMHSPNGRYIIVFNGEIYNYLDLMAELRRLGRGFRGHSDTEVLLAAFEEWGIAPTICKAVGMFAIAVWDRFSRTLSLIRDRVGEKPLFFGFSGDAIVFGSELKALRAHPNWQNQVDRNALAMLMQYGYIPTPHSIYQGIHKLKPGSILTLRLTDRLPNSLPAPESYWSAEATICSALNHPFLGNAQEAIDEFEKLLRVAVAGQMVADVPLGAFLSGGIDSSVIVALMQVQCSRPVSTFSIGFYEKEYNEAPYAKAVAQHLGTNHTELYVTAESARAVIPHLPHIYDEPFSDPSQIPTFLVSKMARHYVTVSLSGDAGDELFAGYSRYRWVNSLWGAIGWLPQIVRSMLAEGMTSVSAEQWDTIYGTVTHPTPTHTRIPRFGDRIHKMARLVGASSCIDMYKVLISNWSRTKNVVIDGYESSLHSSWQDIDRCLKNPLQQMMFLDLITYLPDDILVKLDRAAMSVSLETRVPLLDHRLIEFIWRLPQHMKITHGHTKWLLRQVLYRHVPKHLMERPKMGFSVPIDSWLRGPLREWAEDLLEPRNLHRDGYLNSNEVQSLWHGHLSGVHNNASILWSILMFQAWLYNCRLA